MMTFPYMLKAKSPTAERYPMSNPGFGFLSNKHFLPIPCHSMTRARTCLALVPLEWQKNGGTNPGMLEPQISAVLSGRLIH